jgi:hypothetical protein
MVLWLSLIILVLYWLVIHPLLMQKADDDLNVAKDLYKLVEASKTEENKDQVEQLIVFHNKRITAGANAEESLARLMRDLKRLNGEEEEEELF